MGCWIHRRLHDCRIGYRGACHFHHVARQRRGRHCIIPSEEERHYRLSALASSEGQEGSSHSVLGALEQNRRIHGHRAPGGRHYMPRRTLCSASSWKKPVSRPPSGHSPPNQNTTIRSADYTIVWNALDYPASIFPVTAVDPVLDVKESRASFVDDFDQKIHEMCTSVASTAIESSFLNLSRSSGGFQERSHLLATCWAHFGGGSCYRDDRNRRCST
jgi:hypothetical protein